MLGEWFMKSGLTAGKFAAYMTALALMVIGAVLVMYDLLLVGGILVVGGGWLAYWVTTDGMYERHNDELDNRRHLVDSRTRFAQAITQVDRETREFLALEWPELGVEFGIEPIYYLLDNGLNTNILLDCLRKFLQDSNEIEFVDQRRYNDDKYLQEAFGLSRESVRTQWRLASQYFLRRDYLMHDSMRGSHSYQWKSKGHYRKAVRQYLGAGIAMGVSSQQVEAQA
jgi:hypothetical protein